MLRWILLFSAFAVCALATLTLVKAPTLPGWKLALIAGELGQFLAPIPLVIAVVVLVANVPAALRASTLILCVTAIVLLLKPSFQAWRRGRTLPAQIARELGSPMTNDAAAFSWRRLVTLTGPATARVTTQVFAHAGTPEELSLDVYRASAAIGDKQAPCVVVIHGGGWDNGSRAQLPAFNHYLSARGYVVAAISYRLAPKHRWPDQRDDVLAAIAYLKTHATELGIDSQRIILFGRSAGGQLAEAVGYTANDPAIRGVAAFYAPADLHFAWSYTFEADVLDSKRLMRQFLGGAPDEKRAAFDSASAYLHVGPSTPPTLLVHGALDTLVWHRQSERLAERLAARRVPHVFVSLPWATHAFEFNLNGPSGQLALFALEEFLRAVR